MKKILLSCVLFALTVSVSQAQVLDFIIATVNGKAILASEMEQQRNILAFEQPDFAYKEKDLLEQMILRSIQIERAREAGIRLGDNQINQRLSDIAKQQNISADAFLQSLETFPGGITGFRNHTRDQMTIEQFQRQAILQSVQVDEDEARAFLLTETGQSISQLTYQVAFVKLPVESKADKATLDQLIDESRLFMEGSADFNEQLTQIQNRKKTAEGKVLPPSRLSGLPTIFTNHIPLMHAGEVRVLHEPDKVYLLKVLKVSAVQPVLREEVHSRHILLKASIIRNQAQSRLLMQNIQQRLQKGEDFATLARIYSDDPLSAQEGGDLGWQASNFFVPKFVQQIETLPLHTVSEPFESIYGLHIAEVIGREKRDISEMAELTRIQDHIFQQKINDELPRLLNRIRQSSYVEILSPPSEG